MAVRTTMADLIAKVRLMIADPVSASQQFDDQTIQDRLDASRQDVRYESLTIAPSIVNTASTGNQPQTIFADYYSAFQWWESDAVLQANDTTTQESWVVVTPVASDYIVGHWQFELDVFNSGTVPGQYPPCFITGKTYDLNCAAADLLEFWAASLACAYDVTVDGQSLRRSQLMQGKLTMSQYYRRLAKPKVAKMVRKDVLIPLSTRRMRLLDESDTVK
jgi:hypothetical protein